MWYFSLRTSIILASLPLFLLCVDHQISTPLYSLIVIRGGTGDIQEHRRQLIIETNQDNSLRQYLEWTIQRMSRCPPPVQITNLLFELQDLDYTNTASVVGLSASISLCGARNVHLASNQEDLFVVKPDPSALQVTYERTSKTPPPGTKGQTLPNHPSFISLSHPSTALPAFSLQVGRVLRRDVRPIEAFRGTLVDNDPAKRPSRILIMLWLSTLPPPSMLSGWCIIATPSTTSEIGNWLIPRVQKLHSAVLEGILTLRSYYRPFVIGLQTMRSWRSTTGLSTISTGLWSLAKQRSKKSRQRTSSNCLG